MQEINTKRLLELIDERDKLHPCDDFRIQKKWDEMLYCCGDNENDIVDFISKLDKDRLSTMSEIFEDISIKLKKSKTFKKSLEEITSKYPNVNFSLEYC